MKSGVENVRSTVFILACDQYVKATAVFVLPEDSEYTRGW